MDIVLAYKQPLWEYQFAYLAEHTFWNISFEFDHEKKRSKRNTLFTTFRGMVRPMGLFIVEEDGTKMWEMQACLQDLQIIQ